MIRNLREMNLFLFKAIKRLYLENPVRHCFLFHNVVFETELCEAVFQFRDSDIFSYAMLYRGHFDQTHLHLYGDLDEIFPQVEYWLRRFRRIKVLTYTESARKRVEAVLPELRARYSRTRVLDMVIDEKSFDEEMGIPEAVRMDPAYCAYDVVDLYRSVGMAGISVEDASRLLGSRRCYGYFDSDRRLTAMACRYVVLPEVWVVGEIVTRPGASRDEHVASVIYTLAREGVAGGARVLVMVREDDDMLRGVTTLLGFREIGFRTRLDVETPSSALLERAQRDERRA